MDHDAFEKEMFESVNRHSGEWKLLTFDGEFEEAPKSHKLKVFTKKDVSTLVTGLKVLVVALFTASLFGLAVFAFIATATATGYWAVVLFIAAIVLLLWAFIFLYAQGVSVGGKYESK